MTEKQRRLERLPTREEFEDDQAREAAMIRRVLRAQHERKSDD